jgi:hypothetical protein
MSLQRQVVRRPSVVGARPQLGAVLFGALYAFSFRWRGLLLLGVETLAVMAMVLRRCNGYEGTLLVLVALQLGTRLPPRAGMAWIIARTLLLGAAVTIHWSLRPAFMLMPPYFGPRNV